MDTYSASGLTDARAAEIEVTTGDGVVHRLPVGHRIVHGRVVACYAFILTSSRNTSSMSLPVRLLDRDGLVLWAGQAPTENEPPR